MEHPNHIAMETTNGSQLNLDALYKIAPSCFTEAKGKDGELHRVVDFNKLRLLLGDQTVEDAPEVYDFTWVGKRAALKEAAAPINKTLRPCPEESVDWEHTQNLYIEGDNLEVLKLLQNSYMGKVKMIYIDPPYNTGNDFIYHDDFAQSAEEYDETNRDEDGNRYRKNTDSNGRFHSDWCSMIYARLMLARTLLKEDGIIFISIDDNEYSNLRRICDELLGESSYVTTLHVEMSATQGMKVKAAQNGNIVKNAEYILVYSKDGHKNIASHVLYDFRPDYDAHYSKYLESDKLQNVKDVFAKSHELTNSNLTDLYRDNVEFRDFVSENINSIFADDKISGFEMEDYEEGKVFFVEKNDRTYFIYNNGSKLRQLLPLSESFGKCDDFGNSFGLRKIRGNWWKDFYRDMGNVSKEGDVVFANGKKPLRLIKQLIYMITSNDDIVLDFFSGSATTGHAVMAVNSISQENNKFILVQLPQDISNDTNFENICELGKQRLRNAGKKIKEEHPEAKDLDIGFRVFKCEDSNYKEVAFAPKDYDQGKLGLLIDNIKEDRTDLDLLFDCMLRWGVTLDLPMTTCNVDGCTIHNVNDGDLVACFSGVVTETVIDTIAQMQPLRVVFRDSSFNEAANKMNLFELFKQKCDWTDEEVKNNVRVI